MNEFFRCLMEASPFASSAVSEARDAALHVDAIQSGPLRQLVASAEEVRTARGHRGLVLWGEAGIGKSHVLARLRQWGEREGRACCLFVHHLATESDAQPWYVVKTVIRQLTGDHRGGWRQTPLARLVREAVEQALAKLPPQPRPYRVEQVRDAFRTLVERRLEDGGRAGPETHDIGNVLFHFFLAADRNRGPVGENRGALAAVRWLSGDPLTPSEAAALGLRPASDPHRPVSLSETASAQSVLGTLAELASMSGRAMILCFDPVDGLALEQVRALAQFLPPLVDHARNLLVVLSGEQRALLELVEKRIIAPAVWDRFAPPQGGILLSRISAAQARKLLEARLREFVEPFLTLPAVRRRVEQDPLFPLGSDWFNERTRGQSEFRPRDVIHWAQDRWAQQQAKIHELGGPAWLEGCGSGRTAVSGALAAQSSLVLAPTTQSPGSPRPSPLPSRAVQPQQPPPARKQGRKLEIAVWAVSAALLAAIVLVLAAPLQRAKDSDLLAEGVQSSVPSGNGSPTRRAQISAAQAPAVADATSRAGVSPDPSPAEALPASAQTALPVVQSPPAAVSPPAPVVVPPRPAPPAAFSPRTPAPIVQSPGQLPTSATSGRAVVPGAPGTIAGNVPIAANAAIAGNLPSAPGNPAAGVFPGATGGVGGQVAPTFGGAYARAMSMPVRPPQSVVKAIAVVAEPEIERLVAEAWGLIERGDYEPGRSRLLEARKRSQGDPRADFSLGLLDGLINRDWASAEKRFAECVRCDPTNVPSLNNLAVAQVQNKREAQAVKQWKAIVQQRAATPEVVQNVGRVRALVKDGKIRGTTSLIKSLDELYTEAAVATSWSYRAQTGFRVMALQLADGRSVGWMDPRKMEFGVPSAAAPAGLRPAGTPSNVSTPGAQVPTNPRPGLPGPGTLDPRMRYYGPYAAGAAGGVAPGSVDPRMLPPAVYPPGAAGPASPAPDPPIFPHPRRR